LVIRNEEHRYLADFITHHQYVFDDIFVFDDNSTDRTRDICTYNGLTVVKADGVSFLEHEGKFRYQAWQKFEEKMKPSANDWVFAIDADEFLVAQVGVTKSTVHSTIDLAEYFNYISVQTKINEIWKVENGKCYERKDGLWDRIKASRLFKYQQNGTWNMKAMGCGSVPTYARVPDFKTKNINLLHFGYATKEDQAIKFERYKQAGGHNKNHVLSIIQKPRLQEYEGSVPNWVIKSD
jgi:glycosyltransferase involved in cell wall biosynthesis